uniref:Cytoplasmic polyadenylation element-binding protein 1 n=1 Tax=Ascaris suum TaxID=6253 RepID=F1LCE2_ASCSU
MEERSVQKLMSSCYQMDGKAYLLMSSQTVKQKPVEVRPWRLSDIKYEPYSDLQIDTLRTVFIGAMPRPTRAGKWNKAQMKYRLCEWAIVLQLLLAITC